MPGKATIKKVSSLVHKKYRDEWGLFIAEGDKLVGELLTSSFIVERLFVTEESRLTNTTPSQTELVSEEDMKRLSLLKTPSTSLAIVRIPQYTLQQSSLASQLTIVLDDIQDPGNLGTIIRLADWFGIHTIICSPTTADCYNPKVVQASMGAIARVQLHYLPIAAVLDSLPDSTPVYGTFLEGVNIYTEELSPYGILVMGNEGNGISDEVEQRVTHRIHIPSFAQTGDKSESLNVAVATAIACSEFRRRTLP